jgi:hypothetical protein
VDPRSKGRGCFDGEGAFASDECEGDLRRGKGLAASGTLVSVEGIKTTSAGIGGGVGERLGLMFVTLRFRASRCSKDDGSKCVSRCRRCQHATLAASRLYVRHLEVQFVNGGGAATEQATSVRNRVLVGERSASGASGCAERSPRQHMRVRQARLSNRGCGARQVTFQRQQKLRHENPTCMRDCCPGLKDSNCSEQWQKRVKLASTACLAEATCALL